MIVFDLDCEQAHRFEAWFASSAAFADQCAAGQVICPYCASSCIKKAAMAPRIAAKGSSAPPDTALLATLATLQKAALKRSTWVGSAFPQTARAIHDGDHAPATIHGTATHTEVKALLRDGVRIMPLIGPIVPPEQVN
jgi:hypothetical protein